MIVKIIPSYPAGTGRPLTRYVLELKHENKGEKLGPLVSDPDGHKVEWRRVTNVPGADSPAAAVGALEEYNARNTRAHSRSRFIHVIFSFPPGEKPTRQQYDRIEDRLMEALGLGDHPRVSALHGPDWHGHVAVSRIDPATLLAQHPSYSRFKLQAAAYELESELGLKRELKRVAAPLREEIDLRLTQRKFTQAAHEDFNQKATLELRQHAAHVGIGRPATAEDIAFELDTGKGGYREQRIAANKAREDIRQAERKAFWLEGKLQEAQSQREQRWHELNWFLKGTHLAGETMKFLGASRAGNLFIDPVIRQYERDARNASKGIKYARHDKSVHDSDLDKAMAAQDRALELIRADAQKVLEHRQSVEREGSHPR